MLYDVNEIISLSTSRLPHVESVKSNEFRVPLFVNIKDDESSNHLKNCRKEIEVVYRKVDTEKTNFLPTWEYYCYYVDGQYHFLSN